MTHVLHSSGLNPGGGHAVRAVTEGKGNSVY